MATDGGLTAGSGLGAEFEDQRPSPSLVVALVLVVAGALALTAGAVLPVSPDVSPGFTSWPLLVVLALAPAAAALWCGGTGRPGTAAGLVVGLAALAPGRLLLDLQLLTAGPLAIRPELYLPSRLLDRTAAGPGLWLLLAGDVLTLVALVPAARAARQRAEIAGAVSGRRRWRLVVPLLAVAAAVGLLMAPVRSDDVYLLARSAFEGPWPGLGGFLLLACALPLVLLLGLASASDGVARGTLIGASVAVLAVALPAVVSGLAVTNLHPGFGPALAVVAVVVVLGLAATRLTVPEHGREPEGDLAGEARLPGLFWWRFACGGLAVLTAIAAVIGAFAPQLVTKAGAVLTGPPPESPARWLLLAAGVLVLVLGLLMLAPPAAGAVRPVLAVAWAAVVLAGTAVLGTAVAATDATNLTGFGADAGQTVIGYDLGAGVGWTVAALVLAPLTALAAVAAGVVEREDSGAEGPRTGGAVLTPVVAAAVLAIAAFGTPVFTAPGYVPPGLWANFDTPSWGLLTALVVVLGSLALSQRSRPGPAAAGLIGAALLVAVHAAEYPLIGSALDGARPATGFWLALGALVAVLAAAVMAFGGARRQA
ncbi:hypothetical protein [Amycolatopsis sp. NPDC058986]